LTAATSKLRVILADDHPVVRDGLAAIINQQADMQVVAEAADGEEAIALFHREQPDVMVLDLRMPKRDGVAVVEQVLGVNPKARLLIMTTFDGDEDIFRCLSQGAKGYLLKDSPRQEILNAIRAVSQDQPYTSSSIAAKALQRMAKPNLTKREVTAKTHVKSILLKLDAISRTEAVAVAHKRGLVHL
jgi:two-component system NarL family response regulator